MVRLIKTTFLHYNDISKLVICICLACIYIGIFTGSYCSVVLLIVLKVLSCHLWVVCTLWPVSPVLKFYPVTSESSVLYGRSHPCYLNLHLAQGRTHEGADGAKAPPPPPKLKKTIIYSFKYGAFYVLQFVQRSQFHNHFITIVFRNGPQNFSLRGLRPLTPHQGLCLWTPLGA